MTTSQDVLVRIASITTLTAQDLDDMQACNAVQLDALMRGYENDGKVGDRAIWREVATILAEVAEYAPLAGSIVKIVETVALL